MNTNKDSARSTPTLVNAQLNHKLMPLDRGKRYEDPLNAALQQKGYGALTDGAGTLLSKLEEIEWIDFDFELVELERGIPFVIEQLESYGAPKGSMLTIHDSGGKREVRFGKMEGIAVYLDGVNLPKEVYQASDINVVVAEFNKLLEGQGSVQGHWHGPTESALYMYGQNAELMKSLIADFLATYPLCKGARVVMIAPKT